MGVSPELGLMRRVRQALRPSHEHTALSATLLLMTAVMLSRVIGYVREAYIAYAFGAGPAVDAYVAAFTLPDWLNHLVAGGTASITFTTIFTRALAEKREAEVRKTFSVIVSVMTSALLVGVGLAEIFTPEITRMIFPEFTPDQQELCVRLTRILLPAQIFFYVGGVVSAVLLARRRFLLPAFGPLLYNLFIILGGILLGGRLGIASLAIGALAGSFIGPFLVNAIGAAQTGMGYRPTFDTSDTSFRQWVRLSIPLMLGVSVVTADDWIFRYFASGEPGAIARLNYAKRLVLVPIAVLGQATGQASLPFFARLFGERRMTDFAATVNEAVFHISAVSLLISSWLAAAALPVVDLVYRRGRFDFADAQQTAILFFWFCFSLAFWAAQGLYSRAFYAASDTATPMIAGTVVLLGTIPVYAWMFDRFSVVGLAMASDIAIVGHTLVLALLLHQRKLVNLGLFPWAEISKVALVAGLAGVAASWSSSSIQIDGTYLADIFAVAIVSLVWGGVILAGLYVTSSQLFPMFKRKDALS